MLVVVLCCWFVLSEGLTNTIEGTIRLNYALFFPLLLLCSPCRSSEARTAAAALQEDMASLLGWLDGAEGVLAIPLQPAEPRHLRDTLGKVQVSGADAPSPS